MSYDDVDAGKCPCCGGDLVERNLRGTDWLECEECSYREKVG